MDLITIIYLASLALKLIPLLLLFVKRQPVCAGRVDTYYFHDVIVLHPVDDDMGLVGADTNGRAETLQLAICFRA